MRILSLTFGRTARTPALKAPGIAIAVTREPEREPGLIVYGTCRARRTDVPAGREALPRGVLLVAVNPVTQGSAVLNLVEDRLVFDDDVEEEGSDYVASFRCVLEPSTSMVAPMFFHASFRQYVSDVLWVPLP
ncbi:hypothetical protein HPC49_02610 [Pyxidicoccus fallax]|uniref:Uncharacterized protein n=1 Tax=Pyxidicoccus fallax TaxID=394095 RepID=A0A848L750_9BACT|nr:hypothetical protein [Pyxidicoccus fallax]NMO14357.1 hypothetical protein [Pyxidicoccus fallax]NPC77146.1 hypothetical protein [Pyxidicoccus fallax]